MTKAELAHDQSPEQAAAWLAEGKGAALATVLTIWGSAPRQPGARLAVSSEGELHGSVSGGCVEAAVAAEALEAIADGRPRRLEYGVSDEDAFAVGLACGGRIAVLVDPIVADAAAAPGMPRADLERLIAARAARESLGYEIDLESWERRFLAPGAAPEAFARDRSGFSGPEEARFLAIEAAITEATPAFRSAAIASAVSAAPFLKTRPPARTEWASTQPSAASTGVSPKITPQAPPRGRATRPARGARRR
ncbi:MAG: XdhC family protein [Pseudomonadota bacterium]